MTMCRLISLGRTLSFAAVASIFGCDASSDRRPETAPADAGDSTQAAYLIGTRVWDDVATTSYFQVVRSLDEGTEVDLDRALEVAGSAKLYAVDGIGWFALGDGEAPTITRYTLNGDDELVEDARISLQEYGVPSLWDTLYPV